MALTEGADKVDTWGEHTHYACAACVADAAESRERGDEKLASVQDFSSGRLLITRAGSTLIIACDYHGPVGEFEVITEGVGKVDKSETDEES